MPMSSLLQSDSPPSSVLPGQKRKHISFNTFVEQCIAIDKPKKKRPHYSTPNPHFGNHYPLDDDGSVSLLPPPIHSLTLHSYDEDSEDGIIDEADELLFDDDHDDHLPDPHPPYHPPHHSPPPQHVSPSSSSTSEEDDDDDVLEVRLRHAPPAIPRSPSHSSTSSSSPPSRLPKTRSMSHTSVAHRRRISNRFIMRSPSTDKELVTIALIAPTILKTKMDDDDECTPYQLPHTHLPSYPRPSRDHHNARDWSPYGPHDSPVELVYVPPSYVYSATEESEEMIEEETVACEASLTDQLQFLDQPMSDSPPPATQAQVVQREHSVDTLGLGIDTTTTRMPCRAEGASTVTIEQNPAGPEVIVNPPDPDTPRSRSRSRSRSKSRSRTPSPNTIIASPNAPPSSTTVLRLNTPTQTVGAFLAPSDPGPLRGRSASASSLPSQTQVEQPRGRSIARTSSFSDRESVNTDSPLGRLSPDANGGLGIGSVGVRDREREKEARRTAERGRDRLPRRSGSHSGSGSNSSLSPENSHVAVRAVVEQPQPEQPPAPEVRKKCISVSSSSGSSTLTVVPASTSRSPPRLVLDAKPITQTSYTEVPSTSIPISPSYAQEEQESISRQPTPANSPVLSMFSPPSPSKSSPHPPIVRHERKPSFGSSRSPTRNGDDGQQGTLVGRAVEIMSNAGAFLGSFWNTPPGVPTT